MFGELFPFAFRILNFSSKHRHAGGKQCGLCLEETLSIPKAVGFEPRHQGRRERGGGPGQIFLGGPISKYFPKKFISDYVVIAFQRFYLNFSYQISVLCSKNPNI
jgi:hypothetical protein